MTIAILNLSTVALGQFEMQDLSLEEKVGQLLFVGFQGTEMSPALEKHFQTVRPGGILLFRRNIENPLQVTSLNFQLQKTVRDLTGVPLLLAVDQEGGQVVRVPTQPPLPSPRAIGRARSPTLAYDFGYEMGRLLRGLGFNMNLAPVLDLGSSKKFDFLANRTLGSNPNLISKLGRKFSEGLLAAGVLPTAKHFPGATPDNGDPHKSVIVDRSDLAQIQQRLQPFRDFSQLFPTAMMMSHVKYPNIDSLNLPVGFSKMMMTTILRDDFNYPGLAITDDLMMDGARVYGSLEKAALKAVLAGNNLIMVSWSVSEQRRIFDYLVASVRSGQLPIEVLNERVSRTLKVKRILTGQSHRRQAPRWTSGGLARLESKLLEKNIGNDLLLLQRKSIKDLNGRIYVEESGTNYLPQFERHFPGLVSRVSFAALAKIKTRPGDLIVFFNSNKGRQRMLSSIPSKVKRQTLVVNLVAPGITSDEFWGVLNPYFSHPKLGWEIGSELKRWASGTWSLVQAEARPSSGQSRVGSSPIQHHQGLQPSELPESSALR